MTVTVAARTGSAMIDRGIMKRQAIVPARVTEAMKCNDRIPTQPPQRTSSTRIDERSLLAEAGRAPVSTATARGRQPLMALTQLIQALGHTQRPNPVQPRIVRLLVQADEAPHAGVRRLLADKEMARRRREIRISPQSAKPGRTEARVGLGYVSRHVSIQSHKEGRGQVPKLTNSLVAITITTGAGCAEADRVLVLRQKRAQGAPKARTPEQLRSEKDGEVGIEGRFETRRH